MTTSKHWVRADIPNWQELQPSFEKFILEQVQDNSDLYIYVPRKQLATHCPELVATLESKFGPMERVIVFKMTADNMNRLGDRFIHVDSGAQHARLNWPILNPNSVITKYFDVVTDSPAPTRHMINLPYNDYIDIYPPETCQEIDAVCIDEPTIFTVRHPHGMFVNGDQWPRVMASFNFRTNRPGEILQKHTENS